MMGLSGLPSPPDRAVPGNRERGSGTILALGIIGVAISLLVMVIVLGGALAAKSQAQSAASLGAITGASALMYGESACAGAAKVVRANHALMVLCQVEGDFVRVEARAASPGSLLGIVARAHGRARAGPE